MDKSKGVFANNETTRMHPKSPIVAVLAIVHRQDEFLLIEKENSPDKRYWALPGGVVKLGEKTETAIRREVCEELGLKIKVERLLDVIDDIHHNSKREILYHYVLVCYAASPLGGCKISVSSLAHRWVKPTEISDLPLTKAARLLIEVYTKKFE